MLEFANKSAADFSAASMAHDTAASSMPTHLVSATAPGSEVTLAATASTEPAEAELWQVDELQFKDNQSLFDWLFILTIYFTISLLVSYLLYHIAAISHLDSFETKLTFSSLLLIMQLLLTHVVWRAGSKVIQQTHWAPIFALLLVTIGVGALGQCCLLWG
ncbi:hypothetical protein JYB87_17015 [Shewanella avicenniae]|uniref:Cytochrome c oxidase subunit 4 n=1 Tax=Shewanella avicenniae TaxID=2814294 RepID=A0ABX7QQ47_9GAMM|nr:hypothetical protein [Shewanella avicenniae]QSX33394.1 hypothetical protein JYB87_17015 [Shewanella avicenniae]